MLRAQHAGSIVRPVAIGRNNHEHSHSEVGNSRTTFAAPEAEGYTRLATAWRGAPVKRVSSRASPVARTLRTRVQAMAKGKSSRRSSGAAAASNRIVEAEFDFDYGVKSSENGGIHVADLAAQEASEREAAQRLLHVAEGLAGKKSQELTDQRMVMELQQRTEQEKAGAAKGEAAKGEAAKSQAVKGVAAKRGAAKSQAAKSQAAKGEEADREKAEEAVLAAKSKREAEEAALVAKSKREAEEAVLAEKAKREAEAVLAEKAKRRAEELQRMEVERRAMRLVKLQEEHEFIAAKMFFYPEAPKAGGTVEIFFHRSASVLAGKPGVFIVGGFNDWEWENFQAELQPAAGLSNDWWTVTLPTPKEAYLMNFVFHSSDNVYENNDGNDFFLRVEGEWDEASFETMLNEKKSAEAAKAAAEEEERVRKAREEKRIAELKAQQEAERAQAKSMADDARNRLSHSRQALGHSEAGVWYTKPEVMDPGTTVELLYNRANRPLGWSEKLFLHAGVNNWEKKVSIVSEMAFASNENGDWWSTEIEIPQDAVILNWVLADGPPGGAGVWDNNNRKDYGALVGDDAHVKSLFDAMETRVLRQLEEERRIREEEAAALAAKRALIRAATKEKTKETFLQSQAHVFYTEPAEPKAGEKVRVFYNPNNTVLHGRTRVWMKGSYNRWTHRSGCFIPVEMSPAPNGTHQVAEVTTPADAYVMDLDFLDSPDPNSATYDNRGGLDYHVPLKGASVKEPPLHIVHVALEMAPIAKVGGLGDVVTSLSRACMELGHSVEVIVPKYDCLKYNHLENLEDRGGFMWGGTTWRTWFGFVEGVPTHLLEPENGIFWVGCIYGRKDDADRFATFCNAALEFLVQTGRSPDILHCHDWSSAPVTWLHSEQYKNYGLGKARTVFTIHNMEFGQAAIGRAMGACNMATTVSPTYAHEISGMGAIKFHLAKFHGIINGIDPDIWDPLVDKFIPMNYTSEEVVEGKRAARRALWERLHLQKNERPLVGIVTRLTAQKGIHLIKHAIWRTIERGGQVVLLGSAPDPRVQKDFENLAAQLSQNHNEMARLWLSYDEPLSHLIYAACDMILVPSMFEPCGLTQLIAMRYGAIPVVRKTGGLNDTVLDVDNDQERARWRGLETNGFSFEGTDTAGVDYALNRAISAWYDSREWWNSLAKRVMEQDWSWNRPSLDYMEVYYGARK